MPIRSLLSIGAFGIVGLPSRVVESAIAASVGIAAINNIYLVITRRLWVVAFAFGLIRGFGFASVLSEFGLPPDRKLVALIFFNIGVELRQLAIVAAVLPILFLGRRTIAYTKVVMQVGSLVISMIALIWFIERATGVGDFLGGKQVGRDRSLSTAWRVLFHQIVSVCTWSETSAPSNGSGGHFAGAVKRCGRRTSEGDEPESFFCAARPGNLFPVEHAPTRGGVWGSL